MEAAQVLLDGQHGEAVSEAAHILAHGGLLAFATETVYGLGARADQDRAVAAIYAAKGRPQWHPLIVHIDAIEAMSAFARTIPSWAQQLAHHFWPGPLTLILPRRLDVAQAAAAGADSIGLRCPSHPVAQALLKQASDLGVLGVAAPSANRFGRVSPTTAQHVLKEFAGSVPVLDGGACAVGIESTIVDCTGAQPILLRPGHLTQSRMEAVLGLAFASVTKHAVPRVSGSLASHYAPQARVRLLTPEDSSALAQQMQAHPRRVAVYTLPSSAEEAAHELFARLRDLDQAHVDEIWVSPIPDSEAWDGVRDRLQRAAYNKA